MRTILDYTRTGRWQTITATENAATDIAATVVPRISADACAQASSAQSSPQSPAIAGPGSAIRRLLEFTRTGRWLALTAPVPMVPVRRMPLSAEEQALVDAAFFGLDVEEIPAEKWQEIAPLFAR